MQDAILCQARGQWLSQVTKFEYRVSDIHFDRPWLSCLDGQGKGKHQQPQQERLNASNTKAQAAQQERPWITPGDSVTSSTFKIYLRFLWFHSSFQIPDGKGVNVSDKKVASSNQTLSCEGNERASGDETIFIYGKKMASDPELNSLTHREDGCVGCCNWYVSYFSFVWTVGYIRFYFSLSPTGCPLYGRHQWSKKKVWCCRVGLWLFAPFLILLIALLAFPVIIILIPAGIGYKVSCNCRLHVCTL